MKTVGTGTLSPFFIGSWSLYIPGYLKNRYQIPLTLLTQFTNCIRACSKINEVSRLSLKIAGWFFNSEVLDSSAALILPVSLSFPNKTAHTLPNRHCCIYQAAVLCPKTLQIRLFLYTLENSAEDGSFVLSIEYIDDQTADEIADSSAIFICEIKKDCVLCAKESSLCSSLRTVAYADFRNRSIRLRAFEGEIVVLSAVFIGKIIISVIHPGISICNFNSLPQC